MCQDVPSQLIRIVVVTRLFQALAGIYETSGCAKRVGYQAAWGKVTTPA
jgi:hypothetical protein